MIKTGHLTTIYARKKTISRHKTDGKRLNAMLRLFMAVLTAFYTTIASNGIISVIVRPVYAVPIDLRVKPLYDSSPQAITSINAQPDFSIPESGGKVRLEWSAPSDSDGRSIFSYIIKYATFSVADLGGNTTAWWNHPNTITSIENNLPPQYGRLSHADPGNTEIISISGLLEGEYYYFGIKVIDRYNRRSDWDIMFAQGGSSQSNTFSTTPPWMPSKITDLIAAALEQKGAVSLNWTVPQFLDELGNPRNGHIKQIGYYCIQYSTSYPPDSLNRPNQPNNWESSTRLFISTKDVHTGDIQNYILTGLSHNATYYIHIFTRNEWPNKWSYASYPVVTVRPYITLKPVENLTISASASTDDNIASYATLSWQAPSDEEFLKGTRITYSTTTYPSSPNDGVGYFDIEPLLQGQTTSYTHIQMLPRTTYYYSVWSYDVNRFYSEARYISVYTADDFTAPPAVANITSSITLDQTGAYDLYHIQLNWEIPTQPLYRTIDYKGVKIYYSSMTANTSAHQYLTYKENGASTNIHTVLLPYVTYYYSFATYDSVGNEQPATQRALHNVYISEKYVPPSPPTVITYIYSASRDYAEGCNLRLNWKAPSDTHTSKLIARIGYNNDGYPQTITSGDGLGEWDVTPSFEATNIFKRLISLTTNYISLFAVSSYGVPSRPTKLSVYTYIPWTDTVAPLGPRDLRTSRISDTYLRFSWGTVKYDTNYKAISSQETPSIDELYYYEVFASTSIKSDWTLLTRIAPPQTYCDIFKPQSEADKLIFKVRAIDASNNYSDSATSDSEGNIYIINISSDDPQDIDYVLIPSTLTAILKQTDNPDKDKYILTLQRLYSEEKNNIYKAVEFKALNIISETADSISLNEVTDFSLKDSGAHIAFSYQPLLTAAIQQQNANSKSPLVKPLVKNLSPQEISKSLGLFYQDGEKWQRINLAGADENGFAIAPLRFSGKYQLRYAPTSGEFVFYDVMPKIITPNNDGKNDRALFRFSNPQSARITLKIYDINSVLIRNIGETTETSDIQGEYIYWDGKDEKGNTVQPGVYIYQIELDGKVINGTIVVAR